MRRNLFLILGLLLFVGAVTLFLDYKASPPIEEVPNITSETMPLNAAPDFTFTDINGHKGNLTDLRGKVVILHFWATWCAPCVAELPKLLETSKAMNKDIVLLAVSSDKSPANIAKFLKLHTINLPKGGNIHVIWDQDRAITHDLYQTFAYPETILIDRQGRMARKIPGDADWTSGEMKTLLHSLAE